MKTPLESSSGVQKLPVVCFWGKETQSTKLWIFPLPAEQSRPLSLLVAYPRIWAGRCSNGNPWGGRLTLTCDSGDGWDGGLDLGSAPSQTQKSHIQANTGALLFPLFAKRDERMKNTTWGDLTPRCRLLTRLDLSETSGMRRPEKKKKKKKGTLEGQTRKRQKSDKAGGKTRKEEEGGGRRRGREERAQEIYKPLFRQSQKNEAGKQSKDTECLFTPNYEKMWDWMFVGVEALTVTPSVSRCWKLVTHSFRPLSSACGNANYCGKLVVLKRLASQICVLVPCEDLLSPQCLWGDESQAQPEGSVISSPKTTINSPALNKGALCSEFRESLQSDIFWIELS